MKHSGIVLARVSLAAAVLQVAGGFTRKTTVPQPAAPQRSLRGASRSIRSVGLLSVAKLASVRVLPALAANLRSQDVRANARGVVALPVRLL